MKLFSSLSSLLFPTECPMCSKILVAGENLFCTECLFNFPWADPEFQSMGELFTKLPNDVRPGKLYSLFHYTKGADTKNLLFAIKYHNKPKLAFRIGLMLGEHLKQHLSGDLIIPVPLHPQRRRLRGYNQAEQIANGVSQITGIPVAHNVLERIVNTATLTDSNKANRIEKISRAFKLREPSLIKDKNIILIDDVITTGATIGACLETMHGANVKKITLACIARTSL